MKIFSFLQKIPENDFAVSGDCCMKIIFCQRLVMHLYFCNF